MNARQKAKYYKRKYKEIMNMKIHTPTIYEREKHFEIIRVVREYPEALVIQGDDGFKKWIRDSLAGDIAREALNYMEWRTYFDPHRNVYRLAGEMGVVRL